MIECSWGDLIVVFLIGVLLGAFPQAIIEQTRRHKEQKHRYAGKILRFYRSEE